MQRFTRAFWLAVLLSLLLAGVGGSALAQGPGPTPTLPAGLGTPPPVVCNIGQPCVLDGAALTVFSATTTDTVSGLAAPAPGFTYLVLDVNIVETQGQVPYSPNYFVVRMADGSESSLIPLQSIEGLGNGTFAPGTNLRTNVAFAIPTNATGLVAVYRPLLPGVGFTELWVNLGL